jgi:hypothetical protein
MVEMAPLPVESWLIIFDMVIEEGIVSLDEYHYMIFPHTGSSFSALTRCYQFYDSHLCQRFNSLLGALPW